MVNGFEYESQHCWDTLLTHADLILFAEDGRQNHEPSTVYALYLLGHNIINVVLPFTTTKNQECKNLGILFFTFSVVLDKSEDIYYARKEEDKWRARISGLGFLVNLIFVHYCYAQIFWYWGNIGFHARIFNSSTIFTPNTIFVGVRKVSEFVFLGELNFIVGEKKIKFFL